MPPLRLIFERQWLHFLLLVPLLAMMVWLSRFDAVQEGELAGIATPTWYWLAVAIPIVHQVYVWFCWRTQLHGSLLTRVFGPRVIDLYATVFAVLGLSRLCVIFPLAVSNRDTLQLSMLGMRTLAVLCAIPAVYLFYSVVRYFGTRRAMGIDHFDPAYRTKPMVREGIFRFSSNGMYTFGFLLLWAVALWCQSAAAIAVALFNHLYIWVHYYATERPDMRRIYGVK